LSDLDDHKTGFLNLASMANACGPQVNPYTSILAEFKGHPSKLTFVVGSDDKTIHARNATTIKYIVDLVSRNPDLFVDLGSISTPARLVFQGDDRPTDANSASWQRKKNYENVCLLPDFYYTNNHGYTKFFDQGVSDWSSRRLEFYWRGSTTGGFNNTLDTLDSLPRYRLCQIAARRRPVTDVAFYSVVQAAPDGSEQRIEERLREEDLLRPFADMGHFVERKFILQVDGNGNSWELVRKLRLGSCLLIGDSDWQLWHDQFIRPWEHFVPIKRDYSDLEEIIDWCLAHDDEARQIAENGRAYALSIDFDQEMREAAARLVTHIVSRPV